MDLISLACQEVGLDLSCEVLSPADQYSDLPEPFAVQLHITEEERPDRLETMVPRQLSYQPDQEGRDQAKDVLREVLKEVGVNEMNTNTSMEHIIKSPVQQLLVQRTNPKFFKRARSSQIELGIKGAPCRKLSQLKASPRSSLTDQAPTGCLFELEAPRLAPVSIQADNPFKYLLADTQPGQVAFAFYVMDSWEREQAVGQFDDQDKFLKQCRKWWTAVPTVYRREYWAREQEYRREVEQQRTWGCAETDKENVPLRPARLILKKEAVSVSEQTASLVKAFNSYVSLERAAVSAEMTESSAREVRRELGRRWKMLSLEEKLSYLSCD